MLEAVDSIGDCLMCDTDYTKGGVPEINFQLQTKLQL